MGHSNIVEAQCDHDLTPNPGLMVLNGSDFVIDKKEESLYGLMLNMINCAGLHYVVHWMIHIQSINVKESVAYIQLTNDRKPSWPFIGLLKISRMCTVERNGASKGKHHKQSTATKGNLLL